MRVLERLEIAVALILVQVSIFELFDPKCIINFIDSFRRFVKDIGSVHNPEYGVDIAAGIPHIADYGNIQIDSQLDK